VGDNMKQKKIIDIIEIGSINISKLLLKNYIKLNMTAEEFILIGYLTNLGKEFILDVEKITNDIDININELLNLIHGLEQKKLLNIVVKKNKVIEEYISLESLYEKLANLLIEDYNSDKKENKQNIYECFEKEFARTLSPMEYEIINAWLDSNKAEELILYALKEAVYNGVSNLRYIDKILYEWEKKGFKTVDAVKKHQSNYRSEKKEKVAVFDYNWLDEEE
jgi:DNA replication protein